MSEKIILAGDMAQHWGVAIGSTTHGYGGSMAFDSRYTRANGGIAAAVQETREKIVDWVVGKLDPAIVDFVYYEMPALRGKKSDAAIVSQCVVQAGLFLAGMDLFADKKPISVHNQTLKKAATGTAKADKVMMARAAREMTGGIIFDNDNEADAVCLLFYAINEINEKRYSKVGASGNHEMSSMRKQEIPAGW